MQNIVWNKLLDFETRDLVEKFITTKYNRQVSKTQILGITSNFIQGREYFKNASHSAITVKPLLQYYGVMALSRGLILAISPRLSESSLTPAHGLQVKCWQESLTAENKDFSNLTVVIKQGCFYDLLKATNNTSYFKHNSSVANWIIPFKTPSLETEITLSKLVQTIPDLKTEYESWTGKVFQVSKMKDIRNTSVNEYKYVLPKRATPETIKLLFGESNIININQQSDSTTVIINSFSQLQYSQSFTDPFNAGIGEAVLTTPIDNNIQLNTVSQFYCISYFLSMLSRYFPSVWVSLSRGEKGDGIYPLFTKAIDLIEKYYPSLVLDVLTKHNTNLFEE